MSVLNSTSLAGAIFTAIEICISLTIAIMTLISGGSWRRDASVYMVAPCHHKEATGVERDAGRVGWPIIFLNIWHLMMKQLRTSLFVLTGCSSF
ncbi:uncharacterized protein F5891DRAFT_1065279 [Suillus fuscotomentosus]|uniref:Uncharacterized protein n=1 Tax=Suillus fuscotomentosus TaxID=1912939 RepID=A0AAD4DTS4_9AGAM|nr:uncharacterized protein F5891DRAFT_1065279 [Suillus fuscotomentosus]KAG1893781.1 hypothetical protein F5891DRAFT_1065279 [Suillus fuscotomentosus]